MMVSRFGERLSSEFGPSIGSWLGGLVLKVDAVVAGTDASLSVSSSEMPVCVG
jgi:hypothetical protein